MRMSKRMPSIDLETRGRVRYVGLANGAYPTMEYVRSGERFEEDR